MYEHCLYSHSCTVPERGRSPTIVPVPPSAADPPASCPGACFLSVAVELAVVHGARAEVAVTLILHTGATVAAHHGTLYIADADTVAVGAEAMTQ